MPSSAFERFRKSFLDAMTYQTYRDGLDTEVFSKLTPDELKEAERLLLQKLPDNDSRHVVGLGLLKSKAALPQLYKMFDRLKNNPMSNPALFIQLALARWHIERFPQAVASIAQILDNKALHFSPGIDAVYALGNIGTPEAETALDKVLNHHPEYLLRYHAASQLLIIHGWHWRDAADAIGKLAPRISAMPQEHETLIREIKALFKR